MPRGAKSEGSPPTTREITEGGGLAPKVPGLRSATCEITEAAQGSPRPLACVTTTYLGAAEVWVCLPPLVRSQKAGGRRQKVYVRLPPLARAQTPQGGLVPRGGESLGSRSATREITEGGGLAPKVQVCVLPLVRSQTLRWALPVRWRACEATSYLVTPEVWVCLPPWVRAQKAQGWRRIYRFASRHL